MSQDHEPRSRRTLRLVITAAAAAGLRAAPAIRRTPWPHVLVGALNAMIRTSVFPLRLHDLAGTPVRLCARDAGLGVTVVIEQGRLRVADQAVPRVTISAPLGDFGLLAMRLEDPDTLFFQRRLTVEGDTELGLLIKNRLDATEFDPLAPWTRLIRHFGPTGRSTP